MPALRISAPTHKGELAEVANAYPTDSCIEDIVEFGFVWPKALKAHSGGSRVGRARKHPAGIFRRCRHRCADRPGDPTICASFWECAGIRQDRVHTPCIEDILEFGFVWPKPLKYSFWLARSVFATPGHLAAARGALS